MRLLSVLAALVLGTQPAPQVSPVTVRGIVTQFNTTLPLKDARIKLTPGMIADNPAAPVSAQPGIRSTNTLQEAVQRQQARAREVPEDPPILTDAAGRFEIPNVKPGTYTLSIEREGYFGLQRRDGSFATAAAGTMTITNAQPPDLAVSLIRGGIISGRVADPSGRPAANVAVAPYQTIYREGRLTLVAIAGSVTTDDRGGYRIAGLPPGNYYIAAVPPRPSAIPNPRDSWARTFFPSMTDPSAAVLFEVKPNTEMLTADIAIRPAGTFKVTGTVTNPFVSRNLPNGPDVLSQSFLLVPRGTLIDETIPTQFTNTASEEARRNGEFEIRVPQGEYDLYSTSVSFVDRQLRTISGRTSVDVRNYDLAGAKVDMSAGTTIQGQLVVNEDSPAINRNELKVTLRALDNTPAAVTSRIGLQPVRPDGTFTLAGVPDGLYALSVGPLPPNAYVSDVRDEPFSVLGSGLAVGRNSLGTLQVTIATNAKAIQGVVVDAQGKPVELAIVALIPPADRRQNPILYRSVTSGASGNFSIMAPPGNYKLMAWEAIQPTAWMNAQFVSKYEDLGIPVSVAGGDLSGLQILVIPK